jgi:hypothetical protein
LKNKEQEPSRVCVWCFTFTVHLFFWNREQQQSRTIGYGAGTRWVSAPVSTTFLSEQTSHQEPVLFSRNEWTLATSSSQTNRLNGKETRPYLQAADLLALLVWHCHAHGERPRADLSSSSLLMNRPVSVLWKIETRDNRPWHVPQVKLCYLIQSGVFLVCAAALCVW